MEVARVDENGDLWFFTGDDTAKVREIESDPRVQVICQNGRASFVALGGRATLIRHDRALIRELWKPSFKVWFPGGVEDPNIVLIRVTGERGEYWDHTGVKGLKYICQSIKAVVQGTSPEIKEGEEHGRVNFTAQSPRKEIRRGSKEEERHPLQNPACSRAQSCVPSSA